MWISFFWFKISLFSWQQREGLRQKQKCCVKKGNVIRDMFRPSTLSGFPIGNTFSLLSVRFVEFSGKNCFQCVAMFHCRIFNRYSLRTRRIWTDIYITNEALGRVGYYQLISGKFEKNNCFSKFSSNSLDFFGWNLLKSWHFLYRRRRETIFFDLQYFSTRNSPSVFPYLVKLNDNGSYDGLREPIRKLENHYPELKIY